MNLDQGEALKACAISLPGVGRIMVDLTVRRVTAMAPSTSGAGSLRAGCEFTGMSDEARNMINAYVAALGAPGT